MNYFFYKLLTPFIKIRSGILLIIITFYFLFIEAWSASALELYGVISLRCTEDTGLIINADDKKISLLLINGEYKEVLRQDIKHILVYNLVGNPVKKINLTSHLKKRIKEIYLSGSGKASLIGWPVQFVEEFVVFYDLQGKTNIIDSDKIYAIKDVQTTLPETYNMKSSESIQFSFGQNLPECRRTRDHGELPTRIISDKIKLFEFLGGYERGFQEIRRFQQRTKFYARPYLYNKQTRVGLLVWDAIRDKELPSLIPFNFKWSRGKSYNYQSFVSVGGDFVKWLPNLAPLNVIRSELKLHFFSASLAGNILSLPAGNSFVTKLKFLYTDYFNSFDNGHVGVFTHFNYLALTGIDYGKYSLAIGPSYPIWGVTMNDYFREILSPKPSLIYKFLYTSEKYEFRLVYSSTNISATSPESEDIEISTIMEMKGQESPRLSTSLLDSLSEFSLKPYYVRSGIDWKMNPSINLGVDGVYSIIDYQETLFNQESVLNYSQTSLGLFIRQQFGNYVVLQGNIIFSNKKSDYQIGNQNDKKSTNGFSLLGALEFIL